jgi:hypothetical protein
VVGARPKYDGVSVISKIVNLVSVSVSVRVVHENINGVIPRYIYLYIYIYIVIIIRHNYYTCTLLYIYI